MVNVMKMKYDDVPAEIRSAIETWKDEDKDDGTIRALLLINHGLNESKSRTTLKLYNEANGIETAGGSIDLETMVRLIREGKPEGKTRMEWAEEIAEECDSTKATVNHHISALNFAKEYHKQAMEALEAEA